MNELVEEEYLGSIIKKNRELFAEALEGYNVSYLEGHLKALQIARNNLVSIDMIAKFIEKCKKKALNFKELISDLSYMFFEASDYTTTYIIVRNIQEKSKTEDANVTVEWLHSIIKNLKGKYRRILSHMNCDYFEEVSYD